MSRVKKRWKTFAHVTESENLGYMWLFFFFPSIFSKRPLINKTVVFKLCFMLLI